MRKRLVVGLLIAAVAAIPLAGTDFVAFVFSLGLIYGLVALSLAMLTGWVGQASLGHAAFVGVGAFTAGVLQREGWPFWALIPAAVVVVTPVSLVVGIPALRIRGLQLAVATLAFGWTMERAVFGQVFSSYYSGLEVRRPQISAINFQRDRHYYLLILAVAVVLTLFAGNLRRRSSGRAFSAVRESETVLSHVGGSVASYKLLAFWLSSVYAAIAGVLYGALVGPLNSGLFNLQFSLYVLAIAIVGGMGSLIGPYVAGMAFAWYPQMLSGIEALQYWTYLIGGISLIVFVIALPGGMVALPERAAGLVHKTRRQRGDTAVQNISWELDLSERPALVVTADAPATAASTTGAELEARGALERAERWRLREERRRQRQSGNGTRVERPPLDRTPGRDVHHWARRHSHRPLLRVEDVTMSFGGTVALSRVSMTVRPGEIHGLVGPNGAGKSTLFDCITGVRRPQAGRIYYKRKDLLRLPTHARARLGIARTFQHTNVLPGLSVLDNLLVAEQIRASANLLLDGLGLEVGGEAAAMRQAAENRLAFLGLEAVRDIPVGDLPHGVMKLIELGRALVAGPELVLLDEPAAGLDAHESDQLALLLRQLRDTQQLTILLVEHDMALVMGICDSVTVLDYGKVLASGPPDEVRNDPAVIAAYLGEPVEEEEAADVVVG